MKIKFSLIIFFIFSVLSSCNVSIEEELSTQDLLIGKWQMTDYKINGSLPTDYTTCYLENTIEYNKTELTFEKFDEAENEDICVVIERETYSYTVVDDLIKFNNFNIEIIELNTESLVQEISSNDGVYIEKITLRKIN